MMNAAVSVISAFANPTSLQAWIQSIVNTTPLGIGPAAATIAAHFPKPIMMVPGAVVPIPLTPNIMPIQLLRIGSFALLGVPAEVTTVVGLRFRRVVAARTEPPRGDACGGWGLCERLRQLHHHEGRVRVAGVYEGASTLFGPRTCAAFEKAFGSLAKALALNDVVADDAPQPDLRNDVMTKRRMRFRNLGAAAERFRLYQVGDSRLRSALWSGADFLVEPGAERAVVVPFPSSIFLQNLQVVVGPDPLGPSQPPVRRVFARTSDLIVVDPAGMAIASPCFPSALRGNGRVSATAQDAIDLREDVLVHLQQCRVPDDGVAVVVVEPLHVLAHGTDVDRLEDASRHLFVSGLQPVDPR